MTDRTPIFSVQSVASASASTDVLLRELVGEGRADLDQVLPDAADCFVSVDDPDAEPEWYAKPGFIDETRRNEEYGAWRIVHAELMGAHRVGSRRGALWNAAQEAKSRADTPETKP